MESGDFHWLQMRIAEERERREREAMIHERLPVAAAELAKSLCACVASYTAAFGARSAEVDNKPPNIRVVVREEVGGVVWRERARIEINAETSIPGFQIDRAGSPMLVEVGLLPGEKLYFRDRESDQYLNMEELTRRILDRALFPKLRE